MASATLSLTISKLPSFSPLTQRKAQITPLKLSVRNPNSQRAEAKGLRLAAAKEKVVSGLAVASLVAAMAIPEIAEAAQPGISPSLKNFLLSIVSGGVVLGVIVGAVIGVSNFDPVKRT